MDIKLRPLRALVEVTRQGGFSQAARTVFATQSAVSKAVRQLEEDLGFVLLDRDVRIPLMADSDSIPIADSVPGDGGHVARVS
ncbi:LysR family transcriptional regulator [Ideonella dechloratans]|uniref:LysR family transcriptional regulator n=1 Tax=Ideonella dechloratans TaxID=36863 RepID=A0A643FEY9_IDEDE|nr:LysR family transcriptional regulator [Ideonella dechloratans]UFU08788.1 LysR family transcriptional regulator [Ideonella dechloratans]